MSGDCRCNRLASGQNFPCLSVSHLLLSCFPKYGSRRINDSLRKTDEKNTESWYKIHSNDWGMILNNAHDPWAGNFIYARIIMHMRHYYNLERSPILYCTRL